MILVTIKEVLKGDTRSLGNGSYAGLRGRGLGFRGLGLRV